MFHGIKFMENPPNTLMDLVVVPLKAKVSLSANWRKTHPFKK